MPQPHNRSSNIQKQLLHLLNLLFLYSEPSHPLCLVSGEKKPSNQLSGIHTLVRICSSAYFPLSGWSGKQTVPPSWEQLTLGHGARGYSRRTRGQQDSNRIRRFTISGRSRPGWREASRTSWLILTAAVIPSSLHAESQLGSCKKLPWASPHPCLRDQAPTKTLEPSGSILEAGLMCMVPRGGEEECAIHGFSREHH